LHSTESCGKLAKTNSGGWGLSRYVDTRQQWVNGQVTRFPGGRSQLALKESKHHIQIGNGPACVLFCPNGWCLGDGNNVWRISSWWILSVSFINYGTLEVLSILLQWLESKH
jgi:hypothetical protein